MRRAECDFYLAERVGKARRRRENFEVLHLYTGAAGAKILWLYYTPPPLLPPCEGVSVQTLPQTPNLVLPPVPPFGPKYSPPVRG